MPQSCVTRLLAMLMAVGSVNSAIAAQRGDWQQDFRRCLISKPIDGGRVVLTIDAGSIAIDAQWDGAGAESAQPAKYKVAFDDRAPIETVPDAATAESTLGPVASIAPLFAKARNLTILVPGLDAPDRTVTVAIGDGAGAMAFLKKCDIVMPRPRAISGT